MSMWQVSIRLPAAAAEPFAEALSRRAAAVSRFPEGADTWRIEALFSTRPATEALSAMLAVAAAAAGCAVPEPRVERLPERDWLAENRRSFPPIEAGRFFIHGSHFAGAPPAGRIALCIDAGPAFGSGSHGSTRGCLLALDRLAAGGHRAAPLDLGCGSGILAIAMAKTWGVPVLALDNDGAAVANARANAALNGVGHLVRVAESEGFAAGAVGGRAPFDLIAANILLGPLLALAPALAAHLAPGGVTLLSGITTPQAAELAAACLREGLAERDRVGCEDWVTLVLGRPD